MKRPFYITEGNKDHICEIIKNAEVGHVVTISEPTRNLEQNALLWVYLNALSKQLAWPVMVSGQWKQEKLSDWDWKDFLTGAFEGDARRMAMGHGNTGLVMLGSKTSKYGKKKFAEFIEFVQAFCAQNNVQLPPARED